MKNSGFTLIEIMVGMSAVFFLSFLAIATLSSLQKKVDVGTTTEGIISTLRLARSQTLGSQVEAGAPSSYRRTEFILKRASTFYLPVIFTTQWIPTIANF
jgi:Tfp pilus assembly protein FimT